MTPKALCVFCGSSPGQDPVFRDAARALARELVTRGIRLVYGGGNVGLMGEVSAAVMDAGGAVTGIIPHALMAREKGKRDITHLEVVATMHERKARMAELSDGFIAMPGGYGTLEELFEAVTWSQLGIHRKPVALLNVKGFYDPLLQMLDRAIAEGFLRSQHRGLVLVAETPGALLDAVAAWQAPAAEAWQLPGDKLGT